MTRQTQIKKSLALGTPYVWLTSGAVAFCMILVIGVIGLITVRGAVHFWPKPIVMLNMTAEVSRRKGYGRDCGNRSCKCFFTQRTRDYGSRWFELCKEVANKNGKPKT